MARLGRVGKSIRTNLIGLGDMTVHTKGEVDLQLWHRTNDEPITETKFIVLDLYHREHPQQSFSHLMFPSIDSVDLADPTYNTRGRIDGLIGAEILSTQLQDGLRRNAMGLLAQSTKFGWIIFGGSPAEPENDPLRVVNLVTTTELYGQIRKLWEIDETDDPASMSIEDQECEKLYESTVVHRDGRYGVSLLLKPGATLGESRTTARRRLYGLENRFKREPELKRLYVQFMDEYQRLGHMRKADPLAADAQHYYIPHHAVAIDTRFRVVFDASAKTSNHKSLNELQYTGPRLQRNLADIMMNFRTGQFAMTADIGKMFRQIEVRREFWDYQRILWRTSQDEPITEYWLTVVTYGMASSPYNAVKTLNKCAQDNATEFPRAAPVVERDFYVDDLLTSDETETGLLELQREIIALLLKGSFALAKWRSNCEDVMSEVVESKLVSDSSSATVVGVIWNFKEDVFQIKIQHRIQPDEITKRVMSSEAARVYDPQGWVTPVTIRAKSFIQESWKQKIDWDTPLLNEMQGRWKRFYADVQMLDKIKIPRWLGTSSVTKTQIHVFCDASTKGYGAVVYVRVKANDVWKASLLFSRGRVAPIKVVTIPRLELLAVEVGSGLLQKAKMIPMLMKAETFLWTDSEIALYWLRKSGDQLKTFVGNRVKRVLKVIDVERTYHVRSEQNPADLLSRGVTTETLIDSSLWWTGPDMLRGENDEWTPWNPQAKLTEMQPELSSLIDEEMKEPERQFRHVLLTVNTGQKPELSLMERFSSHHRACRVTAYVLRFCAKFYEPLRKKAEPGKEKFKFYGNQWQSKATNTIKFEASSCEVPWLTVGERENALKYWIRKAQQESYPKGCELIAKGKEVPKSSALWALTPQYDGDGILRIYGRLGNTDLADAVKHPIILHRRCMLARRLAEESHEILCHGGVQMCTQYLRHKYWIIGVRIVLRNVVHNCVVCVRYRQKVSQQFMADLPAMRLNTVPAFYHTGVDFAGPITLKHSRNATTKGYIAVFICMVYKAVHLELVSDLTADAFIAALTRFVNLRAGSIRHMYSDNGTNFVRANRELQEAMQIWQTHEVMEHLVTHSIEWHFNVPSAPHHGGLWERSVRTVKQHLTKMGGAHLFTFEELATLLAKISACINSSPLTPTTTDPNDLETLTPGHFLTGQPIVTPYEGYLEDGPINRLSAWQKIQKLQQDFWIRFSKEYVTEQQTRNKWAKSYRSLKVGDMVFIKNEVTPPCQWLMGRVTEVFAGPDEKVRSCEVKTAKSKFVRPVTRLVLLPIEASDDDDAASEAGFP